LKRAISRVCAVDELAARATLRAGLEPGIETAACPSATSTWLDLAGHPSYIRPLRQARLPPGCRRRCRTGSGAPIRGSRPEDSPVRGAVSRVRLASGDARGHSHQDRQPPISRSITGEIHHPRTWITAGPQVAGPEPGHAGVRPGPATGSPGGGLAAAARGCPFRTGGTRWNVATRRVMRRSATWTA
jgi:hypothetical protein